MINRADFERYLINQHGCIAQHRGRDNGLLHDGHYATFGNHSRTEVSTGRARSFLVELGFEGNEYNEICDDWGIPHH